MPELTRRYIVMAMAAEGPFDVKDPDAAFVLKPWKDPAALRALEAYRDACYPELSQELTVWIGEITSGPRVLGGVGQRNEQHLALSRNPRLKGPSRRRAGPKARTKVAGRKRPIRRMKRGKNR
jgi:hypothetical protein